ncbi:hypothetical protein HMPREF0591_1373 [Mycobacterium parascrofulaceum ATCC BAA-614]|uniref:Uncharacterized protein n=1 Tax=Mycobacterium parascrofulaceum ATCC BAA-614 TaxID=525368 RepID=D5P5C9_9MYCO|nr:hypothetical protein HMPREF0591_1373 [Mycobacterium parascrofulaceum ATCC BAA-614]
MRRWLRRLPAAHLERIYQGGTRQPLELDSDVRCATPQLLHHALSILSTAAYCERHR